MNFVDRFLAIDAVDVVKKKRFEVRTRTIIDKEDLYRNGITLARTLRYQVESLVRIKKSMYMQV